jgi:hypothetical protein
MTDQPMDFRDFLVRKHEQERMAQRFEALFSKSDEDHAADQAELVSHQPTTLQRPALSAPRRSRQR